MAKDEDNPFGEEIVLGGTILEQLFGKNFKHFTLQYMPSVKRRPQHEEDWGDEDTRGVCVKKRITHIQSDGVQFGRYLGNIKGRYWIGTFEADSITPGDAISFSSVAEMKVEWLLD